MKIAFSCGKQRQIFTTYAVARVLAKRPETADLLPHVEDMSKALGCRRKSKSKPATPVTATETSAVTTSSSTTDPKTE
jgi:hypothetical protein